MPSLQDILRDGLGDSSLESISWPSDGNDLDIRMTLPGTCGERLALKFAWVTHLAIDFTFGDYSGQPLLFESQFHQAENGSWSVEFKFGAQPDGFIKFECKDIQVMP